MNIQRLTEATEIAHTMQRAHKAAKALFGEGWPAKVAEWREIIEAHQKKTGDDWAHTVLAICQQLENAPYSMFIFLGAAFEVGPQINKNQ